jgi:RNA polymerase II subunit A small phosphatase-like protein
MVAFWTSAVADYAENIVENVLSENMKPEFLWSRERCTRSFNYEYSDIEYLKNLKKVKLKGYDLDRTIIVENKPENLPWNYGNVVAIKDFIGDPEDRELLRLERYLADLFTVPNVRKVEKRGWQSKYELD